MTSVLVADPDRATRRSVTAALRFAGFQARSVEGLPRAVSAVRRRQANVVILDPAIEPGDGAIAQLRGMTDMPIIVVSASDDPWDKIAALDAGADDYLSKPFNVEELLARLRVVLRRIIARAPVERQVVETPDFTVDLDDRRWHRSDGTEVKLTPTEWRLVELLVRRAGHLVTQSELLEGVWGAKALGKPEYLRVQLAAIRRKVEPVPAHPRYFVTAPGLGHRFEVGIGSRP